MFLRVKVRNKDGKHHRYFSVVENRQVGPRKIAQRTVLYLGEDQRWPGSRVAQELGGVRRELRTAAAEATDRHLSGASDALPEYLLTLDHVLRGVSATPNSLVCRRDALERQAFLATTASGSLCRSRAVKSRK